MSNDSKDHEISLSGSLTKSGAKLKLRSRFLGGVDRLLGSYASRKSAKVEHDEAIQRATTDGKVRLIEAITRAGVDRIKNDPTIAEHVINDHFPQLSYAQANTKAVLIEAAEVIERSTPSETEKQSEEDSLSLEFTDRFGFYAGSASTEELRQRWGRILASEVKKPGTFSRKALRVIDELDRDTASLFERLCVNSYRNLIYKPISELFKYSEIENLISAGLLTSQSVGGQYFPAQEFRSPSGEPCWGFHSGNYAVVFLKTNKINFGGALFAAEPDTVLMEREGIPNMPVFVLTDAGEAINSILPKNENEIANRLARQLQPLMEGEVKVVNFTVVSSL